MVKGKLCGKWRSIMLRNKLFILVICLSVTGVVNSAESANIGSGEHHKRTDKITREISYNKKIKENLTLKKEIKKLKEDIEGRTPFPVAQAKSTNAQQSVIKDMSVYAISRSNNKDIAEIRSGASVIPVEIDSILPGGWKVTGISNGVVHVSRGARAAVIGPPEKEDDALIDPTTILPPIIP